MQTSRKKNSTIAIYLMAILVFSPVATFAQATTTFSGEAVALRANALGISLAISDTGPRAASGGNLTTSVASLNVLGLASADALKRTASGSGSSSQSQSSAAKLRLLGGLVAADVIVNEQTSSPSGNTGLSRSMPCTLRDQASTSSLLSPSPVSPAPDNPHRARPERRAQHTWPPYLSGLKRGVIS